jgi:hypothetical protein
MTVYLRFDGSGCHPYYGVAVCPNEDDSYFVFAKERDGIRRTFDKVKHQFPKAVYLVVAKMDVAKVNHDLELFNRPCEGTRH